MGLETATGIWQLVSTNPVNATDNVSQGDDHIRLIKACLLATFPNINAIINASDEEINRLVGVTASIEAMRGMGFTTQAAPYSLVAGDNGSLIDITNSGTITLPNLADTFACMIGAPSGALTLTSSSGNLEWYSAGGVALPTGNRAVIRGGLVSVHRVSSKWRVWGGGVS